MLGRYSVFVSAAVAIPRVLGVAAVASARAADGCVRLAAEIGARR
jgi:hypothetical protein